MGGTAENRDASDRRNGLHNGVLRLVLFLIEEQRYALSLAAVQRVLPMMEVSPLPRAPDITLGVIRFHGTAVPVLDMRRRFGRPARDYGLTGHLLLAQTSQWTVALPVDEVLGVSDLRAADVIPPSIVLPAIGYVAGLLPLPDGLVLIHDLGTFLHLDEAWQLAAALNADGDETLERNL